MVVGNRLKRRRAFPGFLVLRRDGHRGGGGEASGIKGIDCVMYTGSQQCTVTSFGEMAKGVISMINGFGIVWDRRECTLSEMLCEWYVYRSVFLFFSLFFDFRVKCFYYYLFQFNVLDSR